jgi:iron complex outermembrane receptor protein
MYKTRYKTLGGFLVCTTSLFVSTAFAQDDASDFTAMSLEDLMNVEVTTVSKRPETATDAAAAIYVLTKNDIERSGATTIPDALRLVPGVNVSQINQNSWAVTVRGFNSRFANKLLVMIDGRTVFTPLFSGVNWDKQNIILEDIERIEVVRGPGGTLWGANAVNGVINIITKSSADTQGGMLKASAGDQLNAQLIGRHGGAFGENGTYRVHAKYEEYDHSETATGNPVNDSWELFTAGFRTDQSLNERDTLTVSGDFTTVEAGETLTIPLVVAPFLQQLDANIERTAAHLLAQWSRQLSDNHQLSVQGYIDYAENDIPQGTEERWTYDLSFQHSFDFAEVHDVLWGLGFRHISDDIENSSFVSFENSSRDDQILSGFIQDAIKVSENLQLIIGSKFSHNDYTGTEVQPSARFVYKPENGGTFWGAVSRAVRTPSRAEDSVRLISQVAPPGLPGVNPGPVPLVLQFQGDESVESEILTSYELGMRLRPSENVSFDIATFYNQYDKLRASAVGAPEPGLIDGTPVAIVPLTVAEELEADTYGIEIVTDWQVRDNWRLQASYAHLEVDGDLPSDPSLSVTEPGGSDPQNTATVRSLLDINDNLRIDTAVRHVADLEGFNIDGYTALDARAEYRFNNGLSIAVSGRNLTEDEHVEFGVDPSFATIPSNVNRSVHFSLTKKF